MVSNWLSFFLWMVVKETSKKISRKQISVSFHSCDFSSRLPCLLCLFSLIFTFFRGFFSTAYSLARRKLKRNSRWRIRRTGTEDWKNWRWGSWMRQRDSKWFFSQTVLTWNWIVFNEYNIIQCWCSYHTNT